MNALLLWAACGPPGVDSGEPVSAPDGAVAPELTIPAGSFWMGCNASVDDQCDPDEDPQHVVWLSAYRLDAHEVQVRTYQACIDAGQCTRPSLIDGECNLAAGRHQHPINCITWSQASALCAWQRPGGRLPTEAEWEMAARGACELRPDQDCRDTMPIYPWGDERPTCEYAVMDDGSGPGCGGGTTWPVGSIPAGASPYGVLDMAGNVWEWTADGYDPDFYATSTDHNPSGPPGELLSVRGGRFGGTSFRPEYLRSSNRDLSSPDFFFDGMGVRCARGDDPITSR